MHPETELEYARSYIAKTSLRHTLPTHSELVASVIGEPSEDDLLVVIFKTWDSGIGNGTQTKRIETFEKLVDLTGAFAFHHASTSMKQVKTPLVARRGFGA